MPTIHLSTSPSAPALAKPTVRKKKGRNPFWVKQLHTWHWVSSAVSMIGLLLFAITGITLNHAASIEGAPVVRTVNATLPAPMLATIAARGDVADIKQPLPVPIATWVEKTFAEPGDGIAEWSADEILLPLPRPGGDGWVSIDRTTGAASSEITDRGWISYLNDLHKGRNSGDVWKWFIDIFAGACVLFAVTGFFLLQLHAKKRPVTWPLVAAGLGIPALLAMLFIH